MKFVNIAKEIIEVSMAYPQYCDYAAVKKAIECGEILGGLNDECFTLYTLTQLWGSTTGGFDGIGGSAMTYQNTIVLVPRFTHDALVFFGGRFAYKTPVTELFMNDLAHGSIPGVGSYRKRYDEKKA